MQPGMRLVDKVAIVTGGGRGIGRAIALRFAGEGAKVVVTARSTDQIESVAEEVRQLGGEATAIQVDVSLEDKVNRFVAETVERFDHIDVLVNNAAANLPSINVVDMEPVDWRRVIDVNLTGPYLCARAVLPLMISRKSGKIINVSSIGGRKGGRGRGPYRAAKAGLINFTETLAAETHEHGIDVNCICPGGVDTEMMHIITKGNPGPNLMEPEEIANVAVFLASGESSSITGAAIDAFGSTNPLFER